MKRPCCVAVASSGAPPEHRAARRVRRRACLTLACVTAALCACTQQSPGDALPAGRAALDGGQTRAAVIHLKNAVSVAPASAQARFLLGQALLQQGDASGALVELERGAALGMPPAQAWPVVARAMLALGQLAPLVAGFDGAELPGEPAAAADLATSVAAAYAAQGQRQQSAAAAQRALSLAPQYAPAELLLARLSAADGQLDAALQQVQGVLARDPGNVLAWQLQGDLLAQNPQQLDDAMAAWRHALSLRPVHSPAHVGLLSVLLMQGQLAAAKTQWKAIQQTVPTDPRTMFFEAQIAYREGDLGRARTLARTLIGHFANNASLQQFLGLVELRMDAPLLAEPPLVKALQLVPESADTRRLLAVAYLKTGQPTRLQEVLEPLLARNDAQALMLLADARLQAGRFDEARAVQLRAQASRPDDARARAALTPASVDPGHIDSAAVRWLPLPGLDSASLADKLEISTLVTRREFDAALDAIARLQSRLPAQPDTALLRGRVQLQRGDPTGARKSFESGLQIAPGHLPTLIALAGLDLDGGRTEAARMRLQALLKKEPANATAMVALADVLERSGERGAQVLTLLADAVRLTPGDPRLRIVHANHLARRGDGRAASAALQDAVNAMPGNPALLQALARVQTANGEHEQALVSLGKLVAAQPGATEPLVSLAQVHVAMGNLGAARRALERALQAQPQALMAQRSLIGLELLDKKPQAALALARQVQRQHAGQGVGQLLEGDVRVSTGDLNGALAAYREGLRHQPLTELAAKTHQVLTVLGQADEARRFADEWQRSHPRDSDFAFHLGNAAQARGDAAAAERLFRATLQLQPLHAMAMNNIAWALLAQGKPGAVDLAQRAVDLLPDNPAALDTLARALLADKQAGRAVVVARKALALAPDNAELRQQLAQAQVLASAPRAPP